MKYFLLGFPAKILSLFQPFLKNLNYQKPSFLTGILISFVIVLIIKKLLKPLQKPETKFRKRFTSLLKKIPNAFFESIQQQAINGTPDILGCVNGKFVALELKATSKSNVTELQKHKLNKIKEAGGFSTIVHPDNAEEVLTALKAL